MVDCLIIGHNEGHFPSDVQMVERMGVESGAFRDLALSYVQWDGTPMRALDVFNRLYVPDSYGDRRRYHNFEMLWPAVSYLGSFLSRHGFSFDYVNLFQQEKEDLRRKLEDKPLTVAVTTTLYVTAGPVMEVVRTVREQCPETTIVVGGPFVQNYRKQLEKKDLNALFTMIGADIYVDSNEGELTLARVLSELRDGRRPRNVPNVIYRDGDEFVFNATELESNPLDANPVDYGAFSSSLGSFVSLRTAKSCPYSCAFCGFPARAGKYVYLSPQQVEADLDRIKESGTVTSLTFLDDTFNVPKGRFKKLLRMMIDKQYGFRWNCFYRSDHGDQEVIDLMAEAGCEGVFLGIESGSDRILEAMNKTARRADYLAAIPALKKNGIVTHANLIVGFPGETEETVAETRSLLEEARPDFFRAQLWYADPITPVWEKRDELGIQGSMFTWSHYTMDAKTAIGIVDDLFATVREPHWLPQTGFELWSVFYLMRRGMTLDQVKGAVGAFNSAVAENIGRGKPAEISPGALARLREAYQFTPAGA